MPWLAVYRHITGKGADMPWLAVHRHTTGRGADMPWLAVYIGILQLGELICTRWQSK